MKHVYLLESLRIPNRRCKGLTDDVKNRLKRHNDGEVPSTRPYRPVTPSPIGTTVRGAKLDRRPDPPGYA